MKLKYILLTLSALGFVVGSTTNSIYLDAALPLASILFGLFMVVTVLEKEMALYDEQLGLTKKTKIEKVRERSKAGSGVLVGAH